MSLIFSTGFDTAPSNADLRSQGWVGNSPVPPTIGPAFASPLNNTGIPGRSLRIANYSGSATLAGAPQLGDPGFFNTGKTIKQLWDAGGFVLGARMKFNSADLSGLLSENDGRTGGFQTAVNTSSPRQIAVDGDNIYAIRIPTDGTGTLALQKSTDGGLTWTTLPSPPGPSNLDVDSTLNVVEPGTLMITKGSYTVASPVYTKNDGVSWTQVTGLGNLTFGECIATGNANYPYAFSCGAFQISQGAGIWLSSGTLAGPWTRAVVQSSSASAYPAGPLKFLPGLDSKLYCAYSNGWIAAVDLAVGSGGTMIQQAGLTTAALYSMDYNNGAILLGTSTGVYRALAFGGAWTQISSTPMYSSVLDGTTLVMVGNDSTVYTTTDGLNLTGSLYNGGPNLSGIPFYKILKYKTTFIAYMQNGSLWYCDSPRLREQGGWQCVRWPDRAEQTPRWERTGFGIVGAVAGSINQSAGTFTIASSPKGANTSGLWIGSTVYAAGAREVHITQPNSASFASTSVLVSKIGEATQRSNYHYYEIIAIADPGTVNAFFYAVRIDSGYFIPRSTASLPLAAVGDTTTVALINLPRTGQWTQVDDLYLTDYSGTRNRGTIGPLNIMRRTMATDVTSDWDKVGDALTDAATVTKEGINSDPSKYMTSSVPGAVEAFGTTAGSTPDLSAYSVRAIQVEAYVKKVNALDPNIVLGVGGVEGSVIPLPVTTAPTFVSQSFAVDGGGNAWDINDVPGLVVSVRNSGP